MAQKKAEADDELALFFDLSIDMLCIAGTDAYFKRVNPAWSALGYTTEELLSKPFYHFVHPDDLAATRAEVAKLAQGLATIHFENRYRHKNGTYRWLSWTSRPGEAGALYAIARDVTEAKETEARLRRSEAALKQRNEQLEEAVRARDELVGVISHELKNPLQTLQLNIQLLDRTLPKTPEFRLVRKIAARLEPPTLRMGRLISDLLDLARLDAKALSIEPKRTDLRKLANETFRSVESLAHLKEIDISCEVPENARDVRGDPLRTLQILTNLMDNAIKFTETRGRITLKAVRRGPEIEIQVSDTGKGIKEAELSHIFDRFWQGADDRFKGSGMGLAIVKGLTEAQGGRVWVRSREGAGTTFYFTMPAAA